MASPTKRTTSDASGGRAMVSGEGKAARGASPRSLARKTPATPGIAAAELTSTLVMRAWANVDRTNTACRASSRRTSSVYCPAPVRSRASSRLRTGPPSAELTAMAEIMVPDTWTQMTEHAKRWGVLPSYSSYQGQLVETSTQTEEAILAAMGASGERPPRARRHQPLPETPCAPAPKRAWGWAVQPYAVRSKDSWGIGDMADLRRLARWSRREGASLILLNPLGAQTPTLPHEASPYYASSRRFRNTLYLCIDELDGAEQCAAELDPLRTAAQKLNQQRLIDYDEVFRLKSGAMEAIFQAAPQPRGLVAWARGKGRALRDFATYNALAEEHGPAWRTWPAALRHPRGDGLDTERLRLAERVAFHVWQQFHLDRQMARAAREIGLITDVPVGFASDSFDAWRWQDLLAPDMRVGAPPDEFFPDGQDGGLPPFDPWKLRRAHYEPFVEAMRSAAAHAAGIRLDHVMGLFRLFWICILYTS